MKRREFAQAVGGGIATSLFGISATTQAGAESRKQPEYATFSFEEADESVKVTYEGDVEIEKDQLNVTVTDGSGTVEFIEEFNDQIATGDTATMDVSRVELGATITIIAANLDVKAVGTYEVGTPHEEELAELMRDQFCNRHYAEDTF